MSDHPLPWGVVYYRASDGSIPAEDFLDACPDKVEATLLAVLEAVREAPPPRFSGGGKWEAMHGAMGGYYEIRVTGPARRQYRLFMQAREWHSGGAGETRFRSAPGGGHRRDVQTNREGLQRPRLPQRRP